MSSELPYTLLAVAFSAYLLHDFSLELRKLIKALIASQIIGDLVFAPWLSELPVYRFMSELQIGDRFYALLVLIGCVLMMDFGFRLVRQPRRCAVIADLVRLNASGKVFILIAVVCKVISLGAAGVLLHPLQALSLQPEALVGMSFLDVIGNTLFPIGLAFYALSSPKPRHGFALFCFVLFGMMSAWKGDMLRLAACYIFALGIFGRDVVRKALVARRLFTFSVAILLLLPIKAQFRGEGYASLDPASFLTYFIGGTSGRLTGGIFQTYCEMTRNIRSRSSPIMYGRYNMQALYLWVPRMLWPGKPRVAAEQVYDYLDLTEEGYGTSFAVTLFGTFYLDFGLGGSLLCSFLLGLAFALMERKHCRLWGSDPTWAGVVAALWLSTAFNMAEAGLPPAVAQFLSCMVTAWLGLTLAKWARVSIPSLGCRSIRNAVVVQ
jgi:oligosaccharide repeat unit polymerase